MAENTDNTLVDPAVAEEEKAKAPDIEGMSPSEIAAEVRRLIAEGSDDTKLVQDLLAEARKRVDAGEMTSDQTSEFIDLNEWVMNGEGAEFMKGKHGEVKAKEILREFVDVGTAIADLSTAGQQIAEGEASQTTKPTPPRRYSLDPNISQSITESLRGISPSGIEALVSPVKQDISDAFTEDLNIAKIASSGQAGAFGSLGQAAINRRLRAAGDLGLLRNQIRESNLRNLNYALQNRLGERRLQQQRDLNVFGRNLGQFNLEQQAAGNLEQAGRINRRSSLLNLTGRLLPIADRLISNQAVQGKIGDLANKISNKNNTGGIKDPAIDEGIESEIIDFDDSSLFKYNESLNRDLFMNQIRGIA